MEENEQSRQKWRLSLDSERDEAKREAALKAEFEAKFNAKSKEIDLLCKKYEALQFRLGSKITSVNMDLACLQNKFELEKTRLLREKEETEVKLEKALGDVERFRKLKNEMAKKKRAAEGKADTILVDVDWNELSMQRLIFASCSRRSTSFKRIWKLLAQRSSNQLPRLACSSQHLCMAALAVILGGSGSLSSSGC